MRSPRTFKIGKNTQWKRERDVNKFTEVKTKSKTSEWRTSTSYVIDMENWNYSLVLLHIDEWTNKKKRWIRLWKDEHHPEEIRAKNFLDEVSFFFLSYFSFTCSILFMFNQRFIAWPRSSMSFQSKNTLCQMHGRSAAQSFYFPYGEAEKIPFYH